MKIIPLATVAAVMTLAGCAEMGGPMGGENLALRARDACLQAARARNLDVDEVVAVNALTRNDYQVDLKIRTLMVLTGNRRCEYNARTGEARI